MTLLARVFVAAIVAALPVRAACAQPATVILVRHAEKAVAPADDPVLNESGSQRALDLAASLAGARLNAIFATHLQRTHLTR